MMQTPVFADASCFRRRMFPVLGSEEAVKVLDLVRMTDETVYFLVHEVDKHFTASLRQYFLDEVEGCALPSERVNECEGWHQPTISHELGVALVERLLPMSFRRQP